MHCIVWYLHYINVQYLQTVIFDHIYYSLYVLSVSRYGLGQHHFLSKPGLQSCRVYKWTCDRWWWCVNSDISPWGDDVSTQYDVDVDISQVVFSTFCDSHLVLGHLCGSCCESFLTSYYPDKICRYRSQFNTSWKMTSVNVYLRNSVIIRLEIL